MARLESKALPLKSAYAFLAERGLEREAADIKNMAIDGFPNQQSSVRRGYVVKLLEEHGLLNEFKEKYWHYGSTRGGANKYRRYLTLWEKHERLQEGEEANGAVDDGTDEETAAEQEFAFESELRDFLAHNLGVVEAGLRLFEQGERKGIEFPVDNGFIDILAKDREDRFVVIELKLSRGRNRTIGQLLYYMGWIDQHLAGTNPCRGMIIAREITQDLVVATKRVPGVSLYRYRVRMDVEAVEQALSDE